MRKLLLTVLISLHLAVAVAQSQTASGVLRTARVLNVGTGRMTAPGEILVQGERIAEVGATVSHPAGAQVLDLCDRTLLPGLIDAHVHLFLHPGADGICDMAQARGILTIVDGAHAFSQFPFKVSDFNCDFYGVILHKWTFAPVGTGFLYVRNDQRYMAAARGARPAARERS
jgi:N-acyl-D-aspartate/D-glutamate deacylase